MYCMCFQAKVMEKMWNGMTPKGRKLASGNPCWIGPITGSREPYFWGQTWIGANEEFSDLLNYPDFSWSLVLHVLSSGVLYVWDVKQVPGSRVLQPDLSIKSRTVQRCADLSFVILGKDNGDRDICFDFAKRCQLMRRHCSRKWAGSGT